MNKRFRLFAVLSLVVLLLSLTLSLGPATPASASSADPNMDLKPGKVVAKNVSQAEQDAAMAMWSRDALASAQPMDLLVSTKQPKVSGSNQVMGAVAGKPGSVGPQVAEPGADQAAMQAYPEDWAGAADAVMESESAEALGNPGVFDSYVINNNVNTWKMYPYKWVGRLSFKVPGGTGYCSATALRGNVIVTAAHCLFDTFGSNSWYSGWVFTPAYRQGSPAPYGTFAATTCWIMSVWIGYEAPYDIATHTPMDVGVCKVRTNSAGQSLNALVGSMGRKWDASYVRHHTTFGYPFQDYRGYTLGSAGYYLRTCVSESFGPSTDVKGMGCNLGGGMSGGPWITSYQPNVVAGYIESVSSGIYLGQTNIYGGRFTSNNIVPLCSAAGC